MWIETAKWMTEYTTPTKTAVPPSIHHAIEEYKISPATKMCIAAMADNGISRGRKTKP
jgi:nitrate reductase cytochrome c-type subunit